MTSQARIDANRRNALKSTGPRTPAGKAAVRLNPLWHGAFATDILLPGEDAAAFARLRGLYRPSSQAEDFLVDRMVLASWRLQRLAAMESRVLCAHAGLRSDNTDLLRSIKACVLRTDEEPPSSSEESRPSDPIAPDPIAPLILILQRKKKTLRHSKRCLRNLGGLCRL